MSKSLSVDAYGMPLAILEMGKRDASLRFRAQQLSEKLGIPAPHIVEIIVETLDTVDKCARTETLRRLQANGQIKDQA